MENEAQEVTEQRKVPHRDFYNARKVSVGRCFTIDEDKIVRKKSVVGA